MGNLPFEQQKQCHDYARQINSIEDLITVLEFGASDTKRWDAIALLSNCKAELLTDAFDNLDRFDAEQLSLLQLALILNVNTKNTMIELAIPRIKTNAQTIDTI